MTRDERAAYMLQYRRDGHKAVADRKWYERNAEKKRKASLEAYYRKKFSESMP